MTRVLAPFTPLFSKRIWQNAQVLLMGAMGLDRERRYHRYNRVLGRAGLSSLEVSRVLLGLLLEVFAGEGPLVRRRFWGGSRWALCWRMAG